MNPSSLYDFQMISLIGTGTYSKVFLVRYKKDKKLYALKTLKKKFIIQTNQQHRIMTQKQILTKIDHPFLVKLYCSFQDQKKLYFVLQYCPGGQLFNLLYLKDKLTEDQSKFYAAQIILVLEQLHKNNIIYRDLKPQNIIIDKNGYLKLTDFGLSKILRKQQGIALSICGTPQYLAPEIIKKTGYGIDVDWWQLGCLIHEMLTGKPPFRNQNRMELLEQIIYKNADLSQLSPRVQDLLKKLMQKDFTKRLGHKGVQQIKDHVWFDRINWQTVKQKKIKPPFIPKLTSEIDTRNFDPALTKVEIKNYEQTLESDQDDNEKFKDFSYNEYDDN